MLGWHALEAGLNMNVLGRTTNDLNGFLFLIISVAMFIKSQDKQLFSGTVLMLFPFLWWLVSSPSPDGPLLLCTLYLVFFLLSSKKETLMHPDHPVFFGLIIAMLLLIKITAVPLVGCLLIFRWKKYQSLWVVFFLFAAGLLLVLKNYTISGWLLCPFPWLASNELWTLPEEFYRFEQKSQTDSNSAIWALIATGIILVGVGYKVKHHVVKVGLLVAIIQMGLCIAAKTSLRLALPGFLMLIIIGCYTLAKTKKTNVHWQSGTIIMSVLAIVLLNGMHIKLFQAKIYHGGKPITLEEAWIPHQNTRFSEMKFQKKKEGNVTFFSPEKDYLLFNTFNGPLPTVNQRQIEYFKKRLHIIPQKIGKSHSEGFYSLKIE